MKKYISTKNFEEGIEYIENLNPQEYLAATLFAEIIYNAREDLVKQVIQALEEKEILKDMYYFELAYCYYYGFGLEKDEAKAMEILTEGAKTLWNSPLERKISPYPSKESLVGDDSIKDLMYKHALLKLENDNDGLYLYCLKYGFGTEKDLNKVAELQYENFKKKKPVREDILIDHLKSCNKDDMLMDTYETILSKPVIHIKGGTMQTGVENLGFYTSGRCDYIFDYSYYLINGIGTKKDEAKAIKLLNAYYANIEKISEEEILLQYFLKPLEYLAYCYDNGIALEKDEAKAIQIRQDIDKYSKKTSNRFCIYNLCEMYSNKPLKLGNYKFDTKIFDENMAKYYEEKQIEFQKHLEKHPPKEKQIISYK